MCICATNRWFHWRWAEKLSRNNSRQEVCSLGNPTHAMHSFICWKRTFCSRAKVVSEKEDSSTGVKGAYVDYRMRRITAFDVFNDLFGDYSGPMLSDLLKKKGIKPPRYVENDLWWIRKLVDRIQLLVNAIEDKMRLTYVVGSFRLIDA